LSDYTVPLSDVLGYGIVNELREITILSILSRLVIFDDPILMAVLYIPAIPFMFFVANMTYIYEKISYASWKKDGYKRKRYETHSKIAKSAKIATTLWLAAAFLGVFVI
jgi:hypothetical protein